MQDEPGQRQGTHRKTTRQTEKEHRGPAKGPGDPEMCRKELKQRDRARLKETPSERQIER